MRGDAHPLRLIPARSPKAWGEEIWLDSARPEFPAVLAGGETLAGLLRRRPELLGERSRRLFGDALPVFSKFIRTDFPPLAHIGLKVRVSPGELAGWACREQRALRRLRADLRVPDERSFGAFQRLYGGWAAARALEGWRPDPALDQRCSRDLRPFLRADPARTLAGLAAGRARIAGVLNEVNLSRETGNLFLIKSGLLHGLFGLSLQFHPREPAEQPKSEAWLPLRAGSRTLLAEVQESSATTCSFADFFTPFRWSRGVRFRKGHAETGISDSELRRLSRAMDCSRCSLDDIRCRPEMSASSLGSRDCRLSRLLDRPSAWPYFSVRRIDLAGRPGRPARWVGESLEDAFQQIIVLNGRVILKTRVRLALSPKAPAFIPATMRSNYELCSVKPAAILLISIPR